MAQALRIVSVERGHDPREFGLIAFGGAGPVHAAALAEELQIPEVIVPPAPGAFSALGLVASDLKRDYVAHAVCRSRQHRSGARGRGDRRRWSRRGATMLRAARVPAERQALLRQADVRYRRQAYELTVPIADGADHARDAGRAGRGVSRAARTDLRARQPVGSACSWSICV